MAGEKMNAFQSNVSRQSNRIQAVQRQNSGGSVTQKVGKTDAEKAKEAAALKAQQAANAAKIKEEAARAEAARKKGAEAVKKKKLSAADIAMGKR